MAYTVNQLVTDIKESYPDCSTTKAILLINKEFGLLLQDANAYMNTETSTSVVAGTSQYTLSKDYASISDVTWATSATQAKSLIPWSSDDLDGLMMGLRSVDNTSGTPTHYIIEPRTETLGTHPVVMTIRFYPEPDTSSTGSPAYPRFSVTGSTYVALAAGNNLPSYILDTDWLLNGVCARLAAEAGKWDEVNQRRAIAVEGRQRQARTLMGIQQRTNIHIGFPLDGGDRSF